MTYNEMLTLIQAAQEGGEVQYESSPGNWVTVQNPLTALQYQLDRYRIRPNSNIYPYSSSLEFEEAIKSHGPALISRFGKHPILFFNDSQVSICVQDHIVVKSYIELSKQCYKWQDGQPCYNTI